MGIQFTISSSDGQLLERARRIAEAFVQPYLRDEVVGIVFLGAIVRGYFDSSADIDIAIFKRQAADIPLPEKFTKVEGLEVQCWLSDYESELPGPWDMSRRWTYSQSKIFFDPSGRIARLLAEKVPLRPEERKGMMISGLTLSEWCVNRLTRMWVDRGNLVSAHHMIDNGINYFFEMLFGLNNELVADMKWRYYCVEKLERLPGKFRERILGPMMLRSFTMEELDRRREAFMEIWRDMKPVIEEEAKMTFQEMSRVV